MSRFGRNDPCPCGSGRKFKRCCIGREAELERREDATAVLVGLAAAFPLLRPSTGAMEEWAAGVPAPVTRALIEEGAARVGDEECERITACAAAEYPEVWESLVEDLGDAQEARALVLMGAVAALLAEERDLEASQLDHLEECADCRADPALALADVLQPCDLWSVAEAAGLAEVLDGAGDVDGDRFDAVVGATAAGLWTPAHGRRLALLVGRVPRCLPHAMRPRASESLAAACARFDRDEAVRTRTAALMLADTLAPLRAVEAGARVAA